MGKAILEAWGNDLYRWGSLCAYDEDELTGEENAFLDRFEIRWGKLDLMDRAAVTHYSNLHH